MPNFLRAKVLEVRRKSILLVIVVLPKNLYKVVEVIMHPAFQARLVPNF